MLEVKKEKDDDEVAAEVEELEVEVDVQIEKEDGGEIKWESLEYDGPFIPPYASSNAKLYYGGVPIEQKLSEKAAEAAIFYARIAEDRKDDTFKQNFFTDWRKLMTEEEKFKICSLEECDFREFVKEGNSIKTETDKVINYCIMDGEKIILSSSNIIIRDLVRRGPNRGKLKGRVMSTDVTINRSAGKEQHRWHEIICDNTVMWIAKWNDSMDGKVRYIRPVNLTKCGKKRDERKYDIARELGNRIEEIRDNYKRDWRNEVWEIKQRGAVLYLLDTLALRAGYENHLSTVGCCSLKVKHVLLREENEQYFMKLNFTGKSNIQFVREVEIERLLYENLKAFKKNKKQDDKLFDKISAKKINDYLKNTFMKDLRMHAFRTYKASKMLHDLLYLTDESDASHQPSEDTEAKILKLKKAIEKTAEFLNHKRSVRRSKANKDVTELLDSKLKLSDGERTDGPNESNDELIWEVGIESTKKHYIDPRIIFAYCKKNNIDITTSKIYSKSLMDRFDWVDRSQDEFAY